MKCSHDNHSNGITSPALGKSYISIFHHLETKEIRGLLVSEAFTEVYRGDMYNVFKLHRFVRLIIRNKEIISK